MRKLPFLILSALVFGISLSLSCQDSSSPATDPGVHPASSATSGETTPRIVFLGDSLTAGLGLDSIDESYPMLLGKEIEKKGLRYQIVNAGVSGDTTSGGLERLDWILEVEPAIFVLELGANDMMRGIPPRVIESNLREILTTVQKRYPKAQLLLVGIRAFPNLGAAYSREFEAIYPRLANSLKIPLVPFLLEGVAGDRSLNQKDGIHPTKEGHQILASNVWKILSSLL